MGSSDRRRQMFVAAAALAVTAGSAAPAFGGAFGLREQSAIGQGMSFAGMAAGGGDSISGMFWNPAVVNQVEFLESEQHFSGIFPSSDIDVKSSTPTAFFGDGGDIGEWAALMAGYNAYRVTDKLAIGLSVNTPFGLATDPKHDWAGQTYARSSRVRSVNAAPTVGYQVNDWFSVAAGLQIQYFDIRLRQAVGVAPNTPSATLKGDDIGFGFTAGFTLQPMEGTSIGVGFRSAIKHDLEGKLSIPGPSVKIKADVTLPETVTVGVRQKLTDQFTVLGSVEWTNWSRLDSVKVKSRAGGATVNTLPFGYDDGWFFSVGGEYAYTPDLTLRAGVGYELSPISDKVRSNRLPDDDRWWLSAGASYDYNKKLSFDLGYSYVFVPGKSNIDINPGDPDFNGLPFHADAKSDVHIVSASVRYKFGGEAPAVLVTKY
jgi:long-chain fatty acid transport protein